MKMYKKMAKPVSYDPKKRSKRDVRYIVIHYTGNVGDTAKGNVNYFATTNKREAGAHFFVDQDGNIAIPEGGEITPIALAITVSGEPRLTSRAIFTPTAVDEWGNVTSTALITVPRGCCFNVSVDYVDATTDDPATTPTPVIEVQNANFVVNRVA